jgi:cytochrome c-type biogenesis protein CcmH
LLSISLGQAQSTDRAKSLGAKMMCMCGCNQILTACNHVGCTTSSAMLEKLDQRVANNDSDDLLVQSFVQEYGERVLAEPPAQGFNRVAWMIPGVAFALGLGLVLVVIRQWRQRTAYAPASGPPISSEVLERARRQADVETDD